MDFQDSMNILHKHIQAASRHTIELFSKIDTLHVSSEMANEIKNSMDQITSGLSSDMNPLLVKDQMLLQLKMMNAMIKKFDLIDKKVAEIRDFGRALRKMSKLIEQHSTKVEPEENKRASLRSTADAVTAKKTQDSLRRKYNNKYRYIPKYMEMTTRQNSIEKGIKSINKDVPK